MFARQSTIRLKNGFELETPLLIPSFSSKGSAEVGGIVRVMAEFIDRSVLVSAYDIFYGNISRKSLSFPECIFLDSGGYEARVDHDFSETYGRRHSPKPWSERDFLSVVKGWPYPSTIVVTFDSPTKHARVRQQIARAQALAASVPHLSVELLIKPEGRSDPWAPIEAVTKRPEAVHGFAALGFTEKELGDSVLERMTKLAKLRIALDKAKVSTPIHVFGSLDVIGSSLYFLAGAEIFDGLTWLRFGYHEDQAVYAENYSLLKEASGFRRPRKELFVSMWKDNYYRLQELRERMLLFLGAGDFKVFGRYGSFFRTSIEAVNATVGGR